MEFIEERLQALQATVLATEPVADGLSNDASDDATTQGNNVDDGTSGGDDARTQRLSDRVAQISERMNKLEKHPSKFKSLFTKLEKIQWILDNLPLESPEKEKEISPLVQGPVPHTFKEQYVLGRDETELKELARSMETIRDLERYIQFPFLAEVPQLVGEARRLEARRLEQLQEAQALHDRMAAVSTKYMDMVELVSQKFLCWDLQLKSCERVIRKKEAEANEIMTF